MTPGGSTFSFMWQGTALDAIRKMAAIGLNDFDVLLVPGHLWIDMDAAARRHLRRTLADEGLRLNSLNLPALDLNLCSTVPDMHGYTVATYRDAIRLAADLDAEAVVVVPGRVSALLPPPRDVTMRPLTDGALALAELAAGLGRKLFFELHPQTPVPTADLIGEWVAGLDSPHVTIAYDVANAVFIGEDPVAAIQRWAPLIGQFHLSDASRSAWRHDAFGAGTVPFAEIAAAIAASDFRGIAILEIISANPLSDMQAALDALAQMKAVG
jgi:sugar phosphate isomerase/epimerase